MTVSVPVYATVLLTVTWGYETHSWVLLLRGIDVALAALGSQKSDRPQTPTLRQFHKARGKTPDKSFVKTVFCPNKLPYYTFITDHDFKVVVSEDNPMYRVIQDNIQQWKADNTCLVVVVDNGEKGHWTLSFDTDDNSEWDEKDWGFTLSGYGKPKGKRK